MAIKFYTQGYLRLFYLSKIGGLRLLMAYIRQVKEMHDYQFIKVSVI